jgi:hypothetical protein
MSCWVVPSLAADIWHIPLEQLWRRIREGEIPTHQEDGFTFVDMAPCGPKIQRPPTFTMVQSEEPVGDGAGAGDEKHHEQDEEEDERGPEDETASVDLGDWRAARKKASRLRVPPPRRKPASV